MIIRLTKQDFMRGRSITPNWYPVTVVKFEAKHPKTGTDSMNYVYTVRFPTIDNFEIDHTFNTKALGFMCPFVAALRGQPVNEIMKSMEDGTMDFDTDEAIGKPLQAKVINETFEGRLINKIDGWLPHGASVPF